VYPGSATPPISTGAFDLDVQLGVIPFLYVKNNALTGITNITREQAILLMTASGVGGMPAGFLDGNTNHTSPVYMIGRDSGSGTRITWRRTSGLLARPSCGAPTARALTCKMPGSLPGGLERNVIAGKGDAIGYLGRADLAAIAASASAISYDGVAYSPTTVQNGSYGLWGYEHISTVPVV